MKAAIELNQFAEMGLARPRLTVQRHPSARDSTSQRRASTGAECRDSPSGRLPQQVLGPTSDRTARRPCRYISPNQGQDPRALLKRSRVIRPPPHAPCAAVPSRPVRGTGAAGASSARIPPAGTPPPLRTSRSPPSPAPRPRRASIPVHSWLSVPIHDLRHSHRRGHFYFARKGTLLLRYNNRFFPIFVSRSGCQLTLGACGVNNRT
jgi:hypothetical protein